MVIYKIKTLKKEHTCVRATRNPEANSVWVRQVLIEPLRGNRDMNVEAMHTYIQKNFGVEVGRMQLYRGKRNALKSIEGGHTESYRKLPKYAVEVRNTNPGSIVKLELERISPNFNLPTFKRFFICLFANQTGFKNGCRPFIGVDGCHLKGPYGGILLAAVALHGNNGLFPLAIAVVESECKASWAFFLVQPTHNHRRWWPK